jgi:hypothetical protein
MKSSASNATNAEGASTPAGRQFGSKPLLRRCSPASDRVTREHGGLRIHEGWGEAGYRGAIDSGTPNTPAWIVDSSREVARPTRTRSPVLLRVPKKRRQAIRGAKLVLLGDLGVDRRGLPVGMATLLLDELKVGTAGPVQVRHVDVATRVVGTVSRLREKSLAQVAVRSPGTQMETWFPPARAAPSGLIRVSASG